MLLDYEMTRLGFRQSPSRLVGVKTIHVRRGSIGGTDRFLLSTGACQTEPNDLIYVYRLTLTFVTYALVSMRHM